MKNKQPHCNVGTVFQSKCKFSSFFIFKDKTPAFLLSGIISEFKFDDCHVKLNGKTKLYLKVRTYKRFVFLLLLEREGMTTFVIKEHNLLCNNSSGFGE